MVRSMSGAKIPQSPVLIKKVLMELDLFHQCDSLGILILISLDFLDQ